jgi:hypothetical protein
MRSDRHGRHRVTKAAAVAGGALLVVAICASAGVSRARSAPAPERCTWGASSITASYDDGRVTVSEARTSGCTAEPALP